MPEFEWSAPASQDQPVERVYGIVERVTFHNEENGFCVLRARVPHQRELVTVLGNVPAITAGEYLEAQGSWIHDKKHGIQFKATQLSVKPPTTLTGIEKYLSSGMVRGIGAHFAKKLVHAFGESVLDVIEHTPQRLMELPGIGEMRMQSIVNAWAEQKSIRAIMVFLHEYGVGAVRAVRIYKTYGQQAIEKVRENPYRLALDIRGVGFKTADVLAEKLGIARDSLIRAQAGVRHVLGELCESGHCAAARDHLVKTSIDLLNLPEALITQALNAEIQAGNLVQEEIEGQACLFLAALHQAETAVAERLHQLKEGAPPWGEIDEKLAFPWVEQKTGLKLSPSQQAAVSLVLRHRCTILTGGPGVGKTTVVKSILALAKAKQMRVALCAPTGRAAKRLSEAAGLTAKTIHRLLEFQPQSYAFKYDQNQTLPIDFLIVDEVSMVDIVLMHHLLKAVPAQAALLLVGDVDQLPSVGAGAVLADSIRSQALPTARLTEIFRQAQSSHIIVNAHRINQQQLPLPNQEGSDFYALYVDDPAQIHAKLMHMVTQRIPQHFGYHPVHDIQVLTPMNRGELGARALNLSLQAALNGAAQPKLSRFGWTFAPGDKVIQTVNHYQKEVYNGDIGIVRNVDLEDNLLRVEIDQRLVEYEFNELDELSLAYAITIHKSQGSEYPVVVIPLAMQHYTLLAKNLVYTGITRGKHLVVLIGQKKALQVALNQHAQTARLTKLAQRLQEDEKERP